MNEDDLLSVDDGTWAATDADLKLIEGVNDKMQEISSMSFISGYSSARKEMKLVVCAATVPEQIVDEYIDDLETLFKKMLTKKKKLSKTSKH